MSSVNELTVLCPECKDAFLVKDQDGKIYCEECSKEFIETEYGLEVRSDGSVKG